MIQVPHLGDPGGWIYGCFTPLNHSPCRMKTLYTQASGRREKYIVIQDPTQGTQGDRDTVVLLSCLENGCSFSMLGEFNETVMSGVWIVFFCSLRKCSSLLFQAYLR